MRWPFEISLRDLNPPAGAKFIDFSAETRSSGVDLADGKCIRKGAPDAVVASLVIREA